MVSVFILMAVMIPAVVSINVMVGIPEPLEPLLLAGIALIVISGVAVHLRQRCPRCGYRIGLQTRFLLPASCRSCGVPFRGHDQSL